jgi:tRNA A-37 threonylcarbamoyl transferase component Bud32
VLGGRYRFDRLIAAGGMAQVWEGSDLTLGRKVAIKRLFPHLAADDSFVARFRHEAVSAAKVSHPSIVSIFDTYSGDGTEAIVMELVRGVTLRQHLDRNGALEPDVAAEVTAQVAEALDVAHKAGLVHRDVKPGNILLCDDRRVKVADFGIAKAAEGADLTQEGMMLGTAKYLAPEQVEGKPVDARTDVYALGVVLYEMLCGRPPFVADTDAATALARLHRDAPRPRQVRDSVPQQLDDVTMRAMAREPAARFQSAAEMRGGVLAAARGAGVDATIMSVAKAPPAPATGPVPVGAAPAPPPGEADRPPRRWLLPALVLTLVAVALGVAGLLIAQGLSDSGLFEGDPGGGGGGGGGTSAAALPIAQAIAFDPEGDGGERDAEAPLVFDGDDTTEWKTEGYNNPVADSGKSGVGIVVNLEGPAAIDSVEVSTPNTGWSGQVFVSGQPATDLAGWGTALDSAEGADGTTTFELDGVEGSSVLIWLTDLGPPGDDGKYRGRVGEIRVTGTPV